MSQFDHICDLEESINGMDWAAIDACALIVTAMPPGEKLGRSLDGMNDATRQAYVTMASLEYIESLTHEQYCRARKAAVGY